MMPTFPRPSLSFRTAGFPRYGCRLACRAAPSHALAGLSLLPAIHRLMFGLCLPFAHLVVNSENPALCRGEHSIVRRLGGGVVLRPRGPRSCPSYAVSNRHHLIDPIRPTRGHIAISLQSSLYAMPSLCGSAEATRGWFRAFADHSFLACRSL